eukprot:CAMPEP_0184867956 /NCGR_PEP_ID=MMETSP0580-20130426/28522_1 /TAXON_ID=1118495 /ORGANISM="Dactyliosolen fragilissimus" /LENGTH=145 /DNA_ID=CAMNT_0027368527 /DNA_START=680 /DNA_END=1117 /DNA_ORIENTATION=-
MLSAASRTPSSLNANGKMAVQLASIASSMLASAYQFLQSARLMTHAGFMFPVVGEKSRGIVDSEKKDGREESLYCGSSSPLSVISIMRKAQSAQWLGLRWLYISISILCWTICGEIGFLLSSFALVQFFLRIDQVPPGAEKILET